MDGRLWDVGSGAGVEVEGGLDLLGGNLRDTNQPPSRYSTSCDFMYVCAHFCVLGWWR